MVTNEELIARLRTMGTEDRAEIDAALSDAADALEKATTDIEYGYDDRKTLLDVYYDGGGTVGADTDLHAVYPGLIAVANHALADARGLATK